MPRRFVRRRALGREKKDGVDLVDLCFLIFAIFLQPSRLEHTQPSEIAVIFGLRTFRPVRHFGEQDIQAMI